MRVRAEHHAALRSPSCPVLPAPNRDTTFLPIQLHMRAHVFPTRKRRRSKFSIFFLIFFFLFSRAIIAFSFFLERRSHTSFILDHEKKATTISVVLEQITGIQNETSNSSFYAEAYVYSLNEDLISASTNKERYDLIDFTFNYSIRF